MKFEIDESTRKIGIYELRTKEGKQVWLFGGHKFLGDNFNTDTQVTEVAFEEWKYKNSGE